MKNIWGYSLIICILCTGCANSNRIDAFFAWMDGYLAMETGEEFNVALTCFFDQNKVPFDKNDVDSLSFDNLDKIIISDYLITSLDTDQVLQYDGYVFNLTVYAYDKGIFKTDKIVVTMNDSSIIFPIGNWVFDVQDDVISTDFNGKFDAMSSPVAGTGRDFVYDYRILDPDVKIKNIWISENVSLSDGKGLPSINKIELPETMDAPINFIRPKITLSIGDKEVTALGMSYYSGAMDVQKNILEESREHNSLQ